MAGSETGKGIAPRRSGFVAGLICLVCVVAAAGAGVAAMVAEISAKGAVDTRLIRSRDGVALAVADTRRPIVALSNVGGADTTPPGAAIIIR